MTGVAWPFNETGTSGAPAVTARQLRQLGSAFVAMGSTTRPLGAKSGVRLGTPSTVVSISGTGSYTWSAGGFAGIIDGEANAAAGPYQYAFETADTGPIAAAGASARVDRLSVQISDSDEGDGTGTKSVHVVYTQGAATGGQPPAAPARSHNLALINVPTSGAPTISWAPDWSGDPGEWTFNTLAERDAYVTAIGSSNVPVNQRATVIADLAPINNSDFIWSGSGWLVVRGRPLVPSSVSGGTVSGDGSITVTGSRLNLDGLLTQANIVKIEGTVSIGSNQILFARLRAGGTDVASNTAQELSYAAAGTGTGATAQNPSGTGVWQLGVQQASWHHFTLLLSNAGQALPTIGNADIDTYASLTSMTKVLSSLFQVDAAARDGVGIGAGSIAGTAAMSGTVFCTAIA